MKKLQLLLGLLIFTTCLSAQYSVIDSRGLGARAAGMAYAFNAVADDATAIASNPAGITQLKRPELSFAGTLYKEGNDYANLENDAKSYYSEGPPYSSLDYLSFIYPVSINNRNLVFGISYQIHMNNCWNLTRTYNSSSRSENSQGNTTVNSASFSTGYSLNDFISLGITFNKYFSLGNSAAWNYAYEASDYTYYFQREEEYSFSGFNMTMGALIDFSSMNIPLKLAARVNSPLNLKNDYSSHRDYHYEYPSEDYYHIKTKDGFQISHIPWILGTGVSYRIGDYFTIAADYDLKPFKDDEVTDEYQLYDDFNYDPPMDSLVKTSYDLVQSNENLNELRVGMEYILHPGFGLIPVRVGWKNNPTEIANMDENGDPTEMVRGKSINAGFGYITKYFSLDAAYEYYTHNHTRVNSFDKDYTLHLFTLSVIIYLK